MRQKTCSEVKGQIIGLFPGGAEVEGALSKLYNLLRLAPGSRPARSSGLVISSLVVPPSGFRWFLQQWQRGGQARPCGAVGHGWFHAAGANSPPGLYHHPPDGRFGNNTKASPRPWDRDTRGQTDRRFKPKLNDRPADYSSTICLNPTTPSSPDQAHGGPGATGPVEVMKPAAERDSAVSRVSALILVVACRLYKSLQQGRVAPCAADQRRRRRRSEG
ncbi:unnamed protein product [Pleuronectes platessa]|uniref:Uncharacterized protein n=1 Tax=Pleuronectes platessa TaxID=8262 RepID=A0A9N7YCT2_PLEPL|nr:unnamed protein product [Pleuronectes platessa]